jgi:hypothetical protein
MIDNRPWAGWDGPEQIVSICPEIILRIIKEKKRIFRCNV